jgi:hypothetical protein
MKLKAYLMLSLVAHAYNLCFWETEIKRIAVQSQQEQKFSETPISINKQGIVMYICHPSCAGGCR